MSMINPGPGAGYNYNVLQPSRYNYSAPQVSLQPSALQPSPLQPSKDSGQVRAGFLTAGALGVGAGGFWQWKLLTGGNGFLDKVLQHTDGIVKGFFKTVKSNPGTILKSVGGQAGSFILLTLGAGAFLRGWSGKAPAAPNTIMQDSQAQSFKQG